MKGTWKKIISLVLAIVFVMQLCPSLAFAEGTKEWTLEEAVNSGLADEFSARESEKEYAAEDVVRELEEYRSETEKHFQMSDGTSLAVEYPYPVNYQAEDGKYQEIDNSLALYEPDGTLSTEPADAALNAGQNGAPLEDNRVYRNATGKLRVSFGVMSNAEELAKLSYEDYDISFRPISTGAGAGIGMSGSANAAEEHLPVLGQVRDANEAPEKGSLESVLMPSSRMNAIVYEDFFPSVDLEYIVMSIGVKENIILRERSENYDYVFELNCGRLSAELDKTGNILLGNGEELVFIIPHGYMEDNDGAFSDGVEYSLEEKGDGKYLLTVSCEKEWLDEEERVYPVKIDPTVQMVIPGNILTSTICHPYGTTSFPWPSKYLNLGSFNTNYNWGAQRVAMRVNQLPVIPENSTIIKATLKLHQCGCQCHNSGLLKVKVQEFAELPAGQTADNWTPSFSWNGCPALDDTIQDVAQLTGVIGYQDFEVTRAACKWYDDASTNFGVYLIGLRDTEMFWETYAWAQFNTERSEYVGVWPVFVVHYRNTVGVEPYFSGQSHGIDRAGEGYISDSSGLLTLMKGDAELASTVNPVAVSHVYNSAYATGEYAEAITGATNLYPNMKLGAGWKLDIQQSVTQRTGEPITYIDGDGTAHYFINEYGVLRDEDGLGLTLTISGTNFTMTDLQGNVKYFTNNLLSYITDTNGNRVDIKRNADEQITSVTRTNSGGNEETAATFSYDNNGYLTSITDAAGNSTSYSYDTDGRLVTVTHADGTTASYTYNTDNKLISAKDNESGYSVHYEYHGVTGKITRYYEQAGESMGMEVTVDNSRHGICVYRDSGPDRIHGNSDDILTSCVYDYFGRTINRYSTSADRESMYGASATKYTANSGADRKNNRALTHAEVGLQAVNWLMDPGAEKQTSLSANSSFWKSGVTGAATAAIQTTTVRTGAKALELTLSSVSDTAYVEQSVAGLTANGWYVLSGYVNTSAVTSFGETGGVYMQCGNTQGEAIRWNTEDVADGWERIYVAAQADANGDLALRAVVNGVVGTVYLDDFQVEATPFGADAAPSAMSLVENGAMMNDDLEVNNSGWGHWVPGVSYATDDEFGRVLCITGDMVTCISAYQDVKVNLPGTQTYLLSGWGKASSIPLKGTLLETEQWISYSIWVMLYYAGDSTPELHTLEYDTESEEWQYAVLPIVPKHPERTIDRLLVLMTYSRNANAAYFKNVTLTREDAQSYKYDSNGNLISVSTPGNKEQAYTYSGADLMQQVTKGNGTFNYTYDNRHNVTKVTNDGLEMSLTYDGMGNVTGSVLSGSGTNATMSSSAQYDGSGNRVIKQTDARGNIVEYTYGTDYSRVSNRPTVVEDPNGVESKTTYNSTNGRVTGSEITGTAALSYTYSNGNLSVMTRSSGGITQSYSMSYDGFGRMTGIYVGNISLASYSYAGADGLLQELSYGNGNSVQYTYDELGRVACVCYNHNNDPSLVYGYTVNGQLGRLQDNDNSRDYSYGYDGLDRLLSLTERYNGVGVQYVHQRYDDANRVSGTEYRVSPRWNGTFNTARSYGYSYSSTNGSLTGMTLPGGSYAYSYDGLRRLTERALTLGGGTSAFLTRSYSYLPGQGTNATTNMISQLSTSVNGTAFGQYSYTYDARGNISSITHGNEEWTYTYDNQGQLLTEEYEGPNQEANYSAAYVYDGAGNLQSRAITVLGEPELEPTPAPGTVPFIPIDPGHPIIPVQPTPPMEIQLIGAGEEPDHLNETGSSEGDGGLQPVTHTIHYTYGNSQWADLLTEYDGDSITYDAIGNPTVWYDGASMTWAKGRQLASISATAGNDGHEALSFTYNSDGLRLTKTVGTGGNAVEHRYTWQGSTLIAEAFSDTVLEFFYDESGQPYALLVQNTSNNTTTETWYYYVTNLQGDVVALLDSTGNTVAEYSYNAWGELLTATGTMADTNPIRYRGYYYDSESGFYYLQSRYYDPEICRFINADGLASTGQGILGCNMFAYCGNEPVNGADPSGKDPFGILDWIDMKIIHVMIQIKVAIEYSWAMEIYVKGPKGSGYLDLYDSENDSYYEVKSLKEAKKSRTRNQMEKYNVASVQDTFGNRAKISSIDTVSTLSPGEVNVSGRIQYGIYDVDYYLYAPGLIVYEHHVNWERATTYATAAVIAALIVLFPESAPAGIPAVVSAFA